MSLAVRQVDTDLERQAQWFPEGLTDAQLLFTSDWEPTLKRIDGVLVGCTRAEFDKLDAPLRQLEVNRAHAESLLAVHRSGQLELSEEERTRLLWRALGLVLIDEDDRLVEVASCPELSPHYLTSSPERFVSGLDAVEKAFGQATALAYGALLMAGVRTLADLRKYGIRIQDLFDRLIERPVVRDRFEALAEGGMWRVSRVERVRLLEALRTQLWNECPQRLGRPFLLTQVIDGYLGLRKGGAGDAFGLALLDAIIAAKLTFPVRFLTWEGRYYLEFFVASSGSAEYWNTIEREGGAPLTRARHIGTRELFAGGYLRLARGYAMTKRHGDGVRVAEWVLKLMPSSADAYQVLGECLLGLQRPKEAIAACRSAIEIDRRNADAYVVQGNAYMTLNKWAEAIDRYKMAIAHRVGYAEAYNNLGLALAKNGEPERAIGAYEEATRIRPDYVEAHYNFGNLRLEREQLDEAIQSYQDAVAHAPRFAGAYYNMGQAYYRKGEKRSALEAYLKAVEANPKHAGAWHNLGIVYRDIGEPDKAVEALEKAVSLNPILLR